MIKLNHSTFNFNDDVFINGFSGPYNCLTYVPHRSSFFPFVVHCEDACWFRVRLGRLTSMSRACLILLYFATEISNLSDLNVFS